MSWRLIKTRISEGFRMAARQGLAPASSASTRPPSLPSVLRPRARRMCVATAPDSANSVAPRIPTGVRLSLPFDERSPCGRPLPELALCDSGPDTLRRVADEPLTQDEFARWWSETGERELRQLLFWKWDPIGVNPVFPRTANEYDGYAPQVVAALRNGASEMAIIDLFRTFEHDHMGLSAASVDQLQPLASDIAGWFEQSQYSWKEFGPMRR